MADNALKMKNLLLLILFVCFLACQKHGDTVSASLQIAGKWELIRKTGGFAGASQTLDAHDYLIIRPDSTFGFYNVTGGRLAVDAMTTETKPDNIIWYKFNIDSANSLPVLPMSTSFPKMATLFDADHSHHLILSDPCCDLYSYEFINIKDE